MRSKLLGGASGFAGEFHCQVDPHGPLRKRCGTRGCVETFASTKAIIDDLERAGLQAPSIEHVLRDDSSVARQALWHAGWYLGLALSYAVNLLNPKAVYLNGRVATSLDFQGGVYDGLVRTSLFHSTTPVVAVDESQDPLKSPEVLGAAAIAIHRRIDAIVASHLNAVPEAVGK